MPKKILSVGFVFPDDVCEYVPISSTRSLLDADVVVFRPSLGPFMQLEDYPHSHYKGKPSLTDHASANLRAAASHWKQQIRMAVDAGKTVIVFLTEYEEVYVDTGQRNYSGTGRSRQTTRIVEPFDNYQLVPTLAGKIVPAEGSQMRLSKEGASLVSTYWARFGEQTKYKVIFEQPQGNVLLTAGNVPVACGFTFKDSKGRIIAIPPVDEYDVAPEDLEDVKWQKADKVFAQQLREELLAIDDACRAAIAASPRPTWVNADEYLLSRERELNGELEAVNRAIDAALAKKTDLSEAIGKEGNLRRLLYEQGPALEVAIIEALETLGFKVEPFKEGQSEFDAVFTSPEGRFIGEAEGKDTKAINIDKLRQLEMNIQEDLARE